ncbi:ABC transporter ATP-binding protein [Halostagnicola kamekurae]|uniref:ABC-type D-xylose/L-arabinose transporter n=1 Tax=Halostagnicola kamekurae TaxID=619731 RepID=A0A1I6TQW7_9EURY|nr:ABC transporter ATP-binding protein [Halostagnicola kamekurae]SFS91541.1 putative spermidine/putrescine transport system ATP-binding protein [Halostagnicola kamekurae]
MSDVTLEALTKTYGDEVAVDGIDLTIRDGEILGIVGPSGCGKTTTLRTIAGFETPTHGRVLFDGVDITNVPPEERNAGLVFQSYALFDTMTVRENVAFGPKMQGVSKEKRRDRADELLAMLDIGELADRRPATLSGGQQQRVGLARALAIEPHVLLLDEPMTGLDAELKARLREEIGDLLADLEVTALYVTHDQEEAMAMCDRIAVLNDGTVEQVGTPAEIYRHPTNAFVANFIGSSTLLEGSAENGHIDLGYAQLGIEAPTSGTVTLAARPRAFDLEGTGPISAKVTNVTYLGDRTQLTATVPDGTPVTLYADGAEQYQLGETISLSIDDSRVQILGSQ